MLYSQKPVEAEQLHTVRRTCLTVFFFYLSVPFVASAVDPGTGGPRGNGRGGGNAEDPDA
jgi:hypothetical protein